MIEWFRQLAPREQMILGIGAALAVVIMAWGLVWMPLQNGVGELRASVGERSRLMVDLRRAAGLKATTVVGPAGGNAQDFAVLVDATARPLGLASAIASSRPDAKGTRVTLSEAPFHILVDWLIGLELEHGIRAGDVNLRATARPGLVSGQIVLSRS